VIHEGLKGKKRDPSWFDGSDQIGGTLSQVGPQ